MSGMEEPTTCGRKRDRGLGEAGSAFEATESTTHFHLAKSMMAAKKRGLAGSKWHCLYTVRKACQFQGSGQLCGCSVRAASAIRVHGANLPCYMFFYGS